MGKPKERRKIMDKRKKVAYTLPETLVERLKEYSKERNLNMSVLVQIALENLLRKEEQGVGQ